MGSQNKQRVGRFGKTVQPGKSVFDMKVGEIFYIYKNRLIFTPKGVFLSIHTKIIQPKSIDKLFPDLEQLLIQCIPIERTGTGLSETHFIIDFSEIGYNQLCIEDHLDYQTLVADPRYILFHGFHGYEEPNDSVIYDIDEYTVSVIVENNATDDLQKASLEELKNDLENALIDQDFLKAAELRDKIEILKEK